MLVHGARAVLRKGDAKKKPDSFGRWVREVTKRRGRHKPNIAIANKMVRTGVGGVGQRLTLYDPIRNCCDDLTTPMHGVLVNKADRC